jgi:hypothetical protein
LPFTRGPIRQLSFKEKYSPSNRNIEFFANLYDERHFSNCLSI